MTPHVRKKNMRKLGASACGHVLGPLGALVPRLCGTPSTSALPAPFLPSAKVSLWYVSGSRVARRPREQGCERFLVFLYQTPFCRVQESCSCRSGALLQVETKKPCRAENTAVHRACATALVRPALGGLSYVGQPLHCLLFSVAVLWRACLMWL